MMGGRAIVRTSHMKHNGLSIARADGWVGQSSELDTGLQRICTKIIHLQAGGWVGQSSELDTRRLQWNGISV